MLFGWRIGQHGSQRDCMPARIAHWRRRRPDEPGGCEPSPGSEVRENPLKGSVVCGEAFFPFADGLIAAAARRHRGDSARRLRA
jgi:AICAR transformylase/IMP cyclohydrolase PurH